MDFNSSLQNDHAKKFNKLCVFKELHTKKISKDLNNNEQEKDKEKVFFYTWTKRFGWRVNGFIKTENKSEDDDDLPF